MPGQLPEAALQRLGPEGILAIQRGSGNRAVSALLGRTNRQSAEASAVTGPGIRLAEGAGPSLMAQELFVQRQPIAPAPQAPLIPGLGRARQDMLEKMIQQADFQGALDTLIGFKHMDYEIETNLLANGTMQYGNFRWDGVTAAPKWDQAGNLLPAVVQIGPTAFRSLPYLYAVVMHEYQHVLDHQTAAGRQKREDGEVEAHAWDILHAVELGISRSPDIVADEWNELNKNYGRITDQQALTRVRPVASRAFAEARKLVGGKATLDTFVP